MLLNEPQRDKSVQRRRRAGSECEVAHTALRQNLLDDHFELRQDVVAFHAKERLAQHVLGVLEE